MILQLDEQPRRPGEPIAFSFCREHWPSMEERTDITVACTKVRGRALEDEGVYTVEGTVEAAYQTSCARCLAPVDALLEFDFSEEFARREDENEPDRYLFVGQSLDLSQMVEDAVALNMPLRNLCRPDCAGLCPVCGTDRNESSCDCEVAEDPRRNPFAVLVAKLREENEEV